MLRAFTVIAVLPFGNARIRASAAILVIASDPHRHGVIKRTAQARIRMKPRIELTDIAITLIFRHKPDIAVATNLTQVIHRSSRAHARQRKGIRIRHVRAILGLAKRRQLVCKRLKFGAIISELFGSLNAAQIIEHRCFDHA